MEPRYLSPKEVVTYISLSSLEALYRMVARRQIPFTRLTNRSLRFDRVELDLWLSRRSTKPNVVRGSRNHESPVTA